jgi:hypothetical protein
MIDPKKTYRTRNGREVRILMTDGGDWGFPVIAAYKDADNRWWPLHITADGRHCANKAVQNEFDLIEVKPRIKREVWVNVYDDGHVSLPYTTQQIANAWAGGSATRIACVKLTIDCEEGEGL